VPSSFQSLEELATRVLPRILTQVCRDPGSPFFGAWDRNWWHYKIRDFPSIILQQGGYALHLAADCQPTPSSSNALRQLAAASARFWNQRAIRHGAFEEYYPYEQGYPPLAFSTLAMAKLARDGVIDPTEIRPGLAIAARQLIDRFEPQAVNQQVAGTAAAAMIHKVCPDLIDPSALSSLIDRTLATQHDEGWFPEYDGPDLGYLTVTMDCLWDLFDATGDTRIPDALHRATEFIAWFTDAPPHRAGMHNSRNTDYFVPYALARLAQTPGSIQVTARRVFDTLFHNAASPGHFLNPTDDRYWCHYIGASVFRTLTLSSNSGWDLQSRPACPPPFESAPLPPPPSHRPGSGHIRLSAGTSNTLVSTRKGGIFSHCPSDGAETSDFGWMVRNGGAEWVTHWWSDSWKVETSGDRVLIQGPLVPHSEHASSPLKHAILRAGSFLLGRHLIRILKRLLIFKKPATDLHFRREISFDSTRLTVRDEITGLSPAHQVVPAPRASKRHVASADSYHPEDLLRPESRASSTHRTPTTFTAESTF